MLLIKTLMHAKGLFVHSIWAPRWKFMLKNRWPFSLHLYFPSFFADRKLFNSVSADHWDVLCLDCVVWLYGSANFHISIPLDNRKTAIRDSQVACLKWFAVERESTWAYMDWKAGEGWLSEKKVRRKISYISLTKYIITYNLFTCPLYIIFHVDCALCVETESLHLDSVCGAAATLCFSDKWGHLSTWDLSGIRTTAWESRLINPGKRWSF